MFRFFRILTDCAPLMIVFRNTALKLQLRWMAILACAFISWSTPSAAETNTQFCARVGYPAGSEQFKMCVANVSNPNHPAYRQPVEDDAPKKNIPPVLFVNKSEMQNSDDGEYKCDGPIRLMNDSQIRYCMNKVRSKSTASSSMESSAPKPYQSLTSPAERICLEYGFTKGSSPFSGCLMQLDLARQQAQFAQQQYEIQLKQYEHQMAVAEAQEAGHPQKPLALSRFL